MRSLGALRQPRDDDRKLYTITTAIRSLFRFLSRSNLESLRLVTLRVYCFSTSMFTGLIEEVGSVLALKTTPRETQLQIAAPVIAGELRKGESVAVNGCCLTLSAIFRERLTFDILGETLDRTNFGTLRRDSLVNLERALAVSGRLGGHFVQGHIDCPVRVISFAESGADHRLEVEMPASFARYVASKGSVALNGISLTVAELTPESFAVWIIPHTKRHTNLQHVAAGDQLNAEFDLLAKYVERMMARAASDRDEPSSK